MVHAILDLPIWLVGIFIIGGSAVLGALLVAAVRPFVGRRRGGEHNAVVGAGFATAGTMYSIIAGLLVFGVFSSFDKASTAVADEAGNLITMYHNADSFPQPERNTAKNAIKAYTTSVINDEWPSLADSMENRKTTAALNHIFTVFSQIEPSGAWSTQFSVAYEQLNHVVHVREDRVAHSRAALPPIYWFLLVSGGVLMVVFMAVSFTDSRAMHTIAITMMAAMLGIVIFLLLQVSQPFRGSVSVSPELFEQALVTMDGIG